MLFCEVMKINHSIQNGLLIMPRSRRNGNFLDKTSSQPIFFSNNSDNLWRKKGIQRWCDLTLFSCLFFLALHLSLTRKRGGSHRENQISKRNPRLVKVRFGDLTIPYVVYPRLMQPQMLQLQILVLSERLHLQDRFCITGQSYSTSTNRRHRGKSTTPRNRNQQHKNFLNNYPARKRMRFSLIPCLLTRGIPS